MILGLATELAAIIAPSAAAVLITFINALWNTRQAEHARQREKNQGRRATLYIDFLVFMRAVEDGVDPYEYPDEPVLSARLSAFGSDEVKRLLADYWSISGSARHEARILVERQIAKEMQEVKI